MEYIRLLPKNALSRSVGRVVRWGGLPFLARQARDWFIKKYKIDMSEAELPLESYPTIGELFIRRLKPGLRPIANSAFAVHPCDGQLTQHGPVQDGQILQTKGINYSVADLLKCSASEGDIYRSGYFVTYYLCPTDYHRVHSSVSGEIDSVVHVPGRLWPVNPWSVENISQLFAINERVIFNIKTPLGPVSLVMVGATNVGEISVSFDSRVKTNIADSSLEPQRYSYRPPVVVEKGAELGIFHMGSSVVVLYSQEFIRAVQSQAPQIEITKNQALQNQSGKSSPAKLGQALF